MSKSGLAQAIALVLLWQNASFAVDRAAFEKSITDLVSGVNVRAHPNPITYLGTIGEYYCRLRAQKGNRLDVQEATSALRKAEPTLIPTTADEAMVVGAAMAEAKKSLCP